MKHAGLMRQFSSASSCAKGGIGAKREPKEKQRRIGAGQEPYIYLLVLGGRR